ncbi:ABC transporter permease [Defluviitalea raffinosedens]|uniref:FtsX-like permease family protein n=2 Tax=Defluviitalea raffinosedens TaxID=1450156 RepID=A0A7C8HD19_9FIRM|nr:ABC transporter permease [Defluviitalea raffinosedens]KAE9629099.1 FtsX-like permease family protein [Defluviitalea raffinosedens]MBM7687033.1 ABC-type antimicrobial peptide transport system permease subunit [Defluviitalea raffinosedens]HHW68685.1 ABC transporter permease [Candidatus Epulonipiscium sp.]
MNSIDLILMSMRNLWRRKLRTSLTILGVIIGTSSIVLMLSLGFAMNVNLENSMKRWGDLSVIEVWPDYSKRTSYDETPFITDEEVAEFENLPNVEMVLPELSIYVTAVVGRYKANIDIIGITPAAMKALGYSVEEGREFNEDDRMVMIAGSQIATWFEKIGSNNRRRFFWDGDVEAPFEMMDQVVKITFDQSYGERNVEKPAVKAPHPTNVKVIGMLEEKNYETNYRCYMPVESVKKLILQQRDYEKKLQKANGDKITKKRNDNKFTYQTVRVKANDVHSVEGVLEQIRNMGFEAYSMSDGLKEVKNMYKGIQMVLGGIGAVSLFVAALGITNTMIMSIYERTREIGIMKVIGAILTDIKKMFLIEAGMIGFLGGLIGILISLLISYLLNRFGSGDLLGNMFVGSPEEGVKTYVSVIPVWLLGAALIFSSLIGMIAGYFPARRAMKLSALSAIKTE